MYFSGLVRVNNASGINGDGPSTSAKSVESNRGQSSINSINSEYTENEKHQWDDSITEKQPNLSMVAPSHCNLIRTTLRIHSAAVSACNTLPFRCTIQ